MFRLAPDALEWEVGFRTGRVRYGDIKRVRLSFRPMTLQNHRFIAELWPSNGPKLTIASSSWRSAGSSRAMCSVSPSCSKRCSRCTSTTRSAAAPPPATPAFAPRFAAA